MTGRLAARALCALLVPGLLAASGVQAAVIAVDGTTCNLGNAILSANGDT